MKLSCTPVSVMRTFNEEKMDLEAYLRFCHELELDGIDLLDWRCYPTTWNDFETDIIKLPSLLKEYKLELAAYATKNDFATTDKTEFQKNINIVKQAIEDAVKLNVKTLRIFGGYYKFDNEGKPLMNYADGLKKVLEGIEKCLPYAEKNQVILALENHGSLPGHSYELKRILEYFNSPYLRCTFDCANFVANNLDEHEHPLMAFETLKEYIAHVHVKDFGPGEFHKDRKVEAYVAGEGEVPLRQFSALLEDSGYDGFCSLEYEAGFKVPEIEGVTRSFEYLKEIKDIQTIWDR
jgi:sugar phosphate isomerase/epimerase